jgi:hypothetical protein
VVTEVTGRGIIHQEVLDTAERSDSDRCMDLIERAALDLPPPYRPVAGRPIYQIRADGKTILVAERELVGPLRELVMTTLAPGRAQAGPVDIPRTRQAPGRHSQHQEASTRPSPSSRPGTKTGQ